MRMHARARISYELTRRGVDDDVNIDKAGARACPKRTPLFLMLPASLFALHRQIHTEYIVVYKCSNIHMMCPCTYNIARGERADSNAQPTVQALWCAAAHDVYSNSEITTNI